MIFIMFEKDKGNPWSMVVQELLPHHLQLDPFSRLLYFLVMALKTA